MSGWERFYFSVMPWLLAGYAVLLVALIMVHVLGSG